ncbi:hypothetical protein OPAG_08324 [Rhodococcus opacus PD630]|uniref:hypothetical protein n=1 Tax=Rhodococcus opacus TaxID=37919 RepID=UPI00029CC937|nr:hypothetical protein [Rhodococcus opacus]EHI39058.1 hypothetical protein OPAG_08324 [Rhodococcus opacus PD630]UDH01780.1 hypothetical protein K2Z90_008240 [Rhodococcus opacus PD630]
MSAVIRQPVVGGITGGAGTSMIAAMIDGYDVGKIAGDGTDVVDVLLTRSVDSAVKDAIAAATAMPVRPVLVVVAHSPERWPAPVTQRLKMAEPNLPGVIHVSWISFLAGCVDPWSELVSGIYQQYPPKWAAIARQERERIVAAVTPLVMRPAVVLDSAAGDTAAADDDSMPDDPPRARVS